MSARQRFGLIVLDRYAIEFKHETGMWPIALSSRRGGTREVTRTRRTLCFIVDTHAVQSVAGDSAISAFVSVGEAYCSPSDTYDSEAGRQLALYDAIRSLPKEPRGDKRHLGRHLLAAYLSRPGALPWAIRHGHVETGVLSMGRDCRRRHVDQQRVDQATAVVQRINAKIDALAAMADASLM